MNIEITYTNDNTGTFSGCSNILIEDGFLSFFQESDKTHINLAEIRAYTIYFSEEEII